MKQCKCVIGNSSSGIIEAPSLAIPTVNIGIRQRGRMSSKSVIHCGYSLEEINKAIYIALSSDHFRLCHETKNPYETDEDKLFSKLAFKAIIKVAKEKNTILQKKLSFEVKREEWNTFVKAR
jgi:UDP-N-acetylglucosamine 2-epimerase